MKRVLFVALLLGGCGGPSMSTAKKQWHALTDQQRPSFESAGDAVSIAPTADGDVFGSDATHDCSSCPPR